MGPFGSEDSLTAFLGSYLLLWRSLPLRTRLLFPPCSSSVRPFLFSAFLKFLLPPFIELSFLLFLRLVRAFPRPPDVLVVSCCCECSLFTFGAVVCDPAALSCPLPGNPPPPPPAVWRPPRAPPLCAPHVVWPSCPPSRQTRHRARAEGPRCPRAWAAHVPTSISDPFPLPCFFQLFFSVEKPCYNLESI